MDPVLNAGSMHVPVMRSGERFAAFACLLLALWGYPVSASAEPVPAPVHHNTATVNRAFRPGERLHYVISWSNILKAGTATMEVGEGKGADGTDAFLFVSKARSAGIVTAFYPVNDTVVSMADRETLCSLSYSMAQSHGGRKKQRLLTFDRHKRSVTVVSNGLTATFPVPERIQDALSSLYYLRTHDDLTPGRSVKIDVFDNEKTWSVEVRVLGREKLSTVLGELETIKVVTYPRYEGVFQHKGEIMIWLTDDARKVPVMMQSKLSIGSIIATLEEATGVERAK